MKLWKKIASAATLASALSFSAQADFILDTFVYVDGAAPVAPFAIDIDTTSAVGGALPDNTASIEPLISVTSGASASYVLSSAGGPTGFANPQVSSGDGKLTYNSGSGMTASELVITYSSGNPFDDFASKGSAFAVEIFDLSPGNNVPGGFEVEVEFESVGGFFASFTKTFTSAITSPSMLVVPFLNFAADAGFSFEKVTGSKITFNSAGNGSDFTILAFKVVPTPAPIALLGLSLLGMGIYRRSRKA